MGIGLQPIDFEKVLKAGPERDLTLQQTREFSVKAARQVVKDPQRANVHRTGPCFRRDRPGDRAPPRAQDSNRSDPPATSHPRIGQDTDQGGIDHARKTQCFTGG